ncbi:pilus assembly protein PilP [Pseudomonas sp. F1_0610]|uniref:pilus assembly protein PilP n=1 Tax=Pseudomonas sp. F1_0610 TaxID=3114284 RepID=UPI0039C48282
MRMQRLLLVTSLAAALIGCSGGYSDLEAYTAEVKGRSKTPIEPLPKEIVYEPFTYTVAAKRNPFQPPVKLETLRSAAVAQNVKPDETRIKQFLEGFNIETFTMVGTLTKDSNYYALVRADGGIHRVKVGDYLGRNHGKIISIKPSEIAVVEIVPNGEGGYLERPRTLVLQERS